MDTFLATLGLVLAAEFGDKTQLVAMAFASKYSPWKVLVGVFLAVALLNFMAVALGTYITTFIPIGIIRTVAAFVFILFGVFNLRSGDKDEKEKVFRFGAIATIALTFFVGELGDKTQLMTVTLAARYNEPYNVFIGSTIGMLIADSFGIIVGSTVFKKIPEKVVRIVSSAIFIVFGIIGLYSAFKAM